MFSSRALGLLVSVHLMVACGGSSNPGPDGGGGGAGGGAGGGGGPGADAGPDAGDPDAGPTRWMPTNAAAWYAADFADSIFSDTEGTTVALDGDDVQRWADLLGNADADGRTALEGLGKSSFDGRPSVSFSGTGLECLNLGIANDVPALTVVAIYRPVSSDNDADMWAASTAGGSTVRATLFRTISGDSNKGTGGRRLDADAFAGAGAPSALEDNVSHVSIGILNYAAGDIRLYVDDSSAPVAQGAFASTGNSEATDSGNVWIGTKHGLPANAFRGHFHELIIYQRAITPQEVVAITNHARDYWGVDTVLH